MTFSASSKITRSPRTTTLAAAVVLALALGTGAAMAQPAGMMAGGGPGMMAGGGPGMMAGGGPGMHGAHAMQGGGIEGMLPRALEQAKASLNLTPAQLAAWDVVVAAGKSARDAARASHVTVKDAMIAELAKAEPNLKAVAAVADGVQQQNQAARKAVRDQWLDLYATFTPAQKTIVRDLLRNRLARAEAMQERMRQHWGASGN